MGSSDKATVQDIDFKNVIEEKYRELGMAKPSDAHTENEFEKQFYMALCVFRNKPETLDMFVPTIKGLKEADVKKVTSSTGFLNIV